MLTDVTLSDDQHPFASLIATMSGRSPTPKRIQEGMYESGHWNFDNDVKEGLENFPDLGDKDSFGVCDSPEQFLQTPVGEFVVSSSRKFVVSFVKITKASQEPEGGWRWHKWGPYIGVQDGPTCEYLYDEPEIEEVWTYSVYELSNKIPASAFFVK